MVIIIFLVLFHVSFFLQSGEPDMVCEQYSGVCVHACMLLSFHLVPVGVSGLPISKMMVLGICGYHLNHYLI